MLSDVVLPPKGRCDFCTSYKPVWEYPARTFTIPTSSGPYTSEGAWLACELCAQLVEANQIDAVLDRQLSTKSRHQRVLARPFAKAVQQAFIAHRTGPRQPLRPPAAPTPVAALPPLTQGEVESRRGPLAGRPVRPEDLVCDVDMSHVVAWRYPVASYSVQLPPEMFESDQPWVSEGDWILCARCARLIEANDIDGLVDRNVNAYGNRMDVQLDELRARGWNETQVRRYDQAARGGAALIMRGLLANRTGPRVALETGELPTPSPEAQLAFGEQLKLLHWLESAEGQRLLADTRGEINRRTKQPDTNMGARPWTVALRYGETFYWSPAICEFIRGAADTLDETPWPLTREALPATSGFFYCDRPVVDRGYEIGPLRAIAWTLAFDAPDGIGALQESRVDPQGRGSPDRANGILMQWFCQRGGKLAVGGLSLWRFGQSHIEFPADSIDIEVGRPAPGDVPLKDIMRRHKAALATMLEFVQEQIVVPSRPYRPDRATRKIAERERPEQAPVLRVVELRRRQRPDYVAPTEHKDVEWQVSWVVRGFWRNQLYPSLGIHQPRWIAPYLKGPADKPLKPPKANIFLVDR